MTVMGWLTVLIPAVQGYSRYKLQRVLMMRRKVQSLKIVIIGLNFRAFFDRKTHGDEYLLDLLLEEDDRMRGTPVSFLSRQSEIDCLGSGLRSFEFFTDFLEFFLDVFFQVVGRKKHLLQANMFRQ